MEKSIGSQLTPEKTKHSFAKIIDQGTRILSVATLVFSLPLAVPSASNTSEKETNQSFSALTTAYERADYQDPRQVRNSCNLPSPYNDGKDWQNGQCLFGTGLLTTEGQTPRDLFYYHLPTEQTNWRLNPDGIVEILPNNKQKLIGLCQKGECVLKVRDVVTQKAFYVICPWKKSGILADIFAGRGCQAYEVYRNSNQSRTETEYTSRKATNGRQSQVRRLQANGEVARTKQTSLRH
jgi:hypothetical protein